MLVAEHINTLETVAETLRNQKETLYNRQPIDNSFNNLVSLHEVKNYLPILTTGDGNCLYNALSIVLFGNEDFYYLFKIGIFKIFFEYEMHFRNILEKTFSPHKSFEKFIENAAILNSWGDEICLVALSILIYRPINVYGLDPANKIPYSYEYCIINNSFENNPVNIAFILNHFVALLRKIEECKPPKPLMNQFLTRFKLNV